MGARAKGLHGVLSRTEHALPGSWKSGPCRHGRRQFHLWSGKSLPSVYLPTGWNTAILIFAGKGHIWFNTCPRGGDDVPEGEEVPDPGLPGYEPGESEPEEPEDPDDHWFCGPENPAIWTGELWNDHNMGRWLIQRYISLLFVGIRIWPANVPILPDASNISAVTSRGRTTRTSGVSHVRSPSTIVQRARTIYITGLLSAWSLSPTHLLPFQLQ